MKDSCRQLYKRHKYLQVLPSLQRDLGAPEDQVYQIDLLDQLSQHDLFHQENPVGVKIGGRR